MRRRLLTLLWCTGALVPFAAAADGPAGLPRTLPRDLEIELALSAAPEHLRPGAAVYVLTEDGFELARASSKGGSNGFTCFVTRGLGGEGRANDHVEPMCYDEEGMETFGAVAFDRYRMLRQGVDPQEVRAEIAAGFVRGTYRAPTRGGVIYMLSPINKVPDGRGGVLDYVPHLMFYAPYVSNREIGVTTELLTSGDYAFSGLPFLPATGPHGFIVVPLGREEARQMVRAQRDLIERMRRYVDVELRWE